MSETSATFICTLGRARYTRRDKVKLSVAHATHKSERVESNDL